MKNLLFLVVLFLCSFDIYSQVGVNTTSPTATLHVYGSTTLPSGGGTVNLLNQITPLLLLGNDTYLNTLQPNQLATLSLLYLNIQSIGYGIGLVFFGFYCILIGYAIFKTNAIPKFIAVAYAIAGLCYLINSFTMFLSKGFANPMFVYLAIPIFIGELSLCLWLLIKGIDTTKLENNK